jgi:hypothetical protein
MSATQIEARIRHMERAVIAFTSLATTVLVCVLLIVLAAMALRSVVEWLWHR